MSRKLTRRTFLERLGIATTATLGASTLSCPAVRSLATVANAAEMGRREADDRRWQAYRIRQEAAMAHSNQLFPSFATNGDEEAYPNKIANYTKGLPHDKRGEVDLAAYAALFKALETGQPATLKPFPWGIRSSLRIPKLPMPLNSKAQTRTKSCCLLRLHSIVQRQPAK